MNDAPGLADSVEFELVAPEAYRREEGRIEFGFGEKAFAVVKHAQGDLGAWVEETRAEGFAIAIIDIDEIASRGIGGSGADHVRKDRRIEGDVFELGPRRRPVLAAFGGRNVGAGAGRVGGTGWGATFDWRTWVAGALTIERTFVGRRHGE